MCVHAHVPGCMCEGQSTTFRSRFCPRSQSQVVKLSGKCFNTLKYLNDPGLGCLHIPTHDCVFNIYCILHVGGNKDGKTA